MMKKVFLGAAAILAVCLPAAANADSKGAMKKLGPALERIHGESLEAESATKEKKAPKVHKKSEGEGDRPSSDAARRSDELVLGKMTEDGYVIIDAVASGRTEDLEATVKALGGRNVSAFGRTVSAEFPPSRLADLGASNYLAFARPAMAATNVSLVTSQGDRSMRVDEVRAEFGFDGTGLTIGVLSDSFACLTSPLNAAGVFTTPAEDVANGDLPANVNILSDLPLGDPDCIDEGRAMAQLIFDSLPGAKIAFHTAFNGQADFAEGIIELAKAGADVIVDDVIYFAEPMLQDGIIAQAADEVARLGVPYYSSNGNRARDAFQSDYRPVDTGDGVFHDFDPGPGVDTLNTVTLNGALQTNLAFNWDSPNFSVSGGAGAQNDVDVIMFDTAGNRVADCFPGGVFQFPANGLCQFQFTDGGVPIDGGAGGDAIELVSLVDFVGGSTVQLGFETQSGDPAGFVKFVVFGGGFTAAEYAIDAPSGYGHNNAAGAEGVGAAAFYFTEEFEGDPNTFDLRATAGEPFCDPACLNDFSSAGGTPIFFDTAGNRLAAPDVRFKPGLTGPDGTNTSFFFNDTSRDDDDGDGVFQTGESGEFPNFFGTSAAAPHAAAVAGLMIDAEDSEILKVKKNGQVRYNLCKPKPKKHGRKHGTNVTVAPAALEAQLANGALLGPCSRTEPAEIYEIMRDTAQDMHIRASNGTGATVQTFVEVGPDGFDFDSGFGFIDANKAIEEFLEELDDEDDDD